MRRGAEDITRLRYVRPFEEKQAADDVASRTPCKDFDRFKPLFNQIQVDLDAGVRRTRRFVKDVGTSKATILPGEWFILGGQITYVDRMGEPFRTPNGETDARLRVIYSNATESDLLLRSLQRALYKDDGGRRVSEPLAGPLFDGTPKTQPEDVDYLATGTLYVLQRSVNPSHRRREP